MDNNETQINLFLDLSKAFDTLDHRILLNKQNHYDIEVIALNLIMSYLSNRSQYVQFNDTASDIIYIEQACLKVLSLDRSFL